ncbi:TPA: hypothetical protein QFM60_002320, partial [Enterococcus faecium]
HNYLKKIKTKKPNSSKILKGFFLFLDNDIYLINFNYVFYFKCIELIFLFKNNYVMYYESYKSF